VPAANPETTTPIFVAVGDERLTVPVAGVAVNQGALLIDAVQSSVSGHVPLAVMVADCFAGFGLPAVLMKFRAVGVPVILQAACSVKFTAMTWELPGTVCPELSVAVTVTMPV
jgi:hypothetical protein